MQLITNPKFIGLDSNGRLLNGGKLYAYYPGTDDPKETYTIAGAAQTNPVVLNARGEPDNAIYGSGSYKLVLKDADDVTIWTEDDIPFGTGDIVITTITDNTTWTGSYNLAYGSMITVATDKTLTINGPFNAGLYKVFECQGTGKVIFGPGAVERVPPEWFGAVADNSTVSTAALQAAFNAFGGVDENSIHGTVQLYGKYVTDDDLILPKWVNLLGAGTGTGITGANNTEYKISVTTFDTDIGITLQTIQDLVLSYAWLAFGETDKIAGHQSLVNRCEFYNTTKGLYYLYGSWGMTVRDCRWWNVKTGIYFDFGASDAGTYHSGSPVTVDNCLFDNCVNSGDGCGIYIAGQPTDGVDLRIIDPCFINSDWGIISTNSDGSESAKCFLTNPHFENNLYGNIKILGTRGYSFYIDGLWDMSTLPVGTGIAKYSIAAGAVRIFSGRLTHAATKLVNLEGGYFYVDPSKVGMAQILGTGSTSMCVANPAGSLQFPKNYIYSETWAETTAMTATNTQIDTIYAGDVNTHKYHLDVSITAGTGTPVFYSRFWDGTGTWDASITLPNESGTVHADIIISPAANTILLTFVGSSTYRSYYAQQPHTRAVGKSAGLNCFISGTTGATISRKNLIKTVM